LHLSPSKQIVGHQTLMSQARSQIARRRDSFVVFALRRSGVDGKAHVIVDAGKSELQGAAVGG
jgi:hypothetical protein